MTLMLCKVIVFTIKPNKFAQTERIDQICEHQIIFTPLKLKYSL